MFSRIVLDFQKIDWLELYPRQGKGVSLKLFQLHRYKYFSKSNHKECASTHGQRFWVINHLCETCDDDTECKTVLWNFAGQHFIALFTPFFLRIILMCF